MKWQNRFATGIKKVDDEHKILIDMIDRLEKAISTGNDCEAARKVLYGLVDYVKIHFKNEEEVMKKIGFPDLNRHKIRHKHLVNEVASILMDLKCGKTWTVHELVGFLQHWLVDHIIEEDVKIGMHLGII